LRLPVCRKSKRRYSLDCRPEKEGIETGRHLRLPSTPTKLDCRPEKEGIETDEEDEEDVEDVRLQT